MSLAVWVERHGRRRPDDPALAGDQADEWTRKRPPTDVDDGGPGSPSGRDERSTSGGLVWTATI